MKISIENFKSIKKLQNFKIKPFNILSGVNSSGKSSFIQLLLLLKQTVELDSSKNPFLLDGELYKIKEFADVISNKNLEKKLKVSFEFNKSEIEQFQELDTISIFKSYDEYSCKIDIQYDINGQNKPFVTLFTVRFIFIEGKEQYISFKSNIDSTFSIDTNTGIFGNKLYVNSLDITNIHYSSFYPSSYESIEESETEYASEVQKIKNKELINLDDIKLLINSFLQNISYIGPNRERPKDEYSYSSGFNNVGSKGEFTAQILEEEADSLIHYFKVEYSESGITYVESKNKTLIEAVNYWMCDVFEVAKNIHAEKTNETYKIVLTGDSGLQTSIKHVGFGISQLLPIVVEGLRMANNGTMIIEQPEIHLHPKLQSMLYDFLYSLTKQGKIIIVETHSSQLITRMRRRIAEDGSNIMDDLIGLTFIENNIFRSIELDDYGTMDYFPENFIEASNTELKAIVKAQMRKHKENG